MPASKPVVSSPWSAPRDRAVERQHKMEAVLHAAAQAFSESGYHRTSLDGIAERLGVTKPTLYYYAAGKDELIAAVVGRAMDQIRSSAPIDTHACGLDQLKQMVRGYAEVVASDFGRCLAQLNDADVGGAVSERIRDGKRAIDQQIRALIDRGKADGSIAPCDTRMTAFMIGGAINGIARWYHDDGELAPAAVAEAYVNQLTSGLAPRP